MRLDLLLVRLRLVRSRALARRWIEEGHIRCNKVRVTRIDHPVTPGAVLTLPIGRSVRIIRIETLPDRRGPAKEAQLHYRELDARACIAIAGAESRPAVAEHEGQASQ